MKSLSHTQTQAFIHLGQRALDPQQTESLKKHLSGCQACREYAALQEQLAPDLVHQMHIRWDAEIENFRPAPMPTNLRSKTMLFKRVVAFAAAGLVVVAVILGAPALLRRALPSALTQQTVPFSTPAGTELPAALPASPTPVLHTIAAGDTLLGIALRYGVTAEDILETNPGLDENSLVVGKQVIIPDPQIDPTMPTNPLPLQLDPTVCTDQATPDPEGEIRAYPVSGVIGGGKVQNGDFTFTFWLYCDEILSPEDMEHFSDLGGLGVYARWTYKGHKIEGEFWDMFGVNPNVRMVTGSPMLSNSGASIGMGLQLPDEPAGEWEVPELARSGEPVRFVVKVQSIDGIYGAELAFRLHAGKNGYIPEGIEVQALPVEAILETRPVLP